MFSQFLFGFGAHANFFASRLMLCILPISLTYSNVQGAAEDRERSLHAALADAHAAHATALASAQSQAAAQLVAAGSRQASGDEQQRMLEREVQRLRAAHDGVQAVLRANEALIAGQNRHIAQMKRDAAGASVGVGVGTGAGCEIGAVVGDDAAAQRMDSRAVSNLKLALDAAAAAAQASGASRQISRVGVVGAGDASGAATPTRSVFLSRSTPQVSLSRGAGGNVTDGAATPSSSSSSVQSRFAMFMRPGGVAATLSAAAAAAVGDSLDAPRHTTSILTFTRPGTAALASPSAAAAADGGAAKPASVISLRLRRDDAASTASSSPSSSSQAQAMFLKAANARQGSSSSAPAADAATSIASSPPPVPPPPPPVTLRRPIMLNIGRSPAPAPPQ